MAFTPAEWKRFYGRGGAWTAVLIVAGLIGIESRNWFDDPTTGETWFNTRTAAEIVAGAMEREKICERVPKTNWVPRAVVADMIYGPNNYGAVINPVLQRSFFANLDPTKYAIQWTESAPGDARTWADLWAYDDPTEPFDGVAAFDPLSATNAYVIGVGWWDANVWNTSDGQWYPVTNSWVLTTNLLHCIGRSMTACRWTVEPAVSPTKLDSALGVGVGHGASSDNWGSIRFDAMWDIVDDWASSPREWTTNGAAILQHHGYLYWKQDEPPDRERTVTLIEHARYQYPPDAAYMGSLQNAWGVGMLFSNLVYAIPGVLYFDKLDFFHASGRAASTAMEVTDCLSVTIGDLSYLRHNLASWDGWFFATPASPFYGYSDFPNHTTNDAAISGSMAFGWSFGINNQAILCQWNMEHMTNRAAFFPE